MVLKGIRYHTYSMTVVFEESNCGLMFGKLPSSSPSPLPLPPRVDHYIVVIAVEVAIIVALDVMLNMADTTLL